MSKVTSSLKRIIFLMILLSVIQHTGLGQSSETTPYLGTDHEIKPMYFKYINPSIPSQSEKIDALIGYQSGTSSLRKNIRSFYSNVLVHVGQSDSMSQSHFIGISIKSTQEGPLLSQNQAMLRYVLQLPLNANSTLKTGIDLGTIQYDIGASGKNGGISKFVPTGNFAVSWLYKTNTVVGIAVNQLLNNAFDIGTSQPTQLIRHFQIHGSHELFNNTTHHVNVLFWDRYVPTRLNEFGGYMTYGYLNNFTVSVGFDSDFMGILTVGVTNWLLGENTVIDAFVGYAIPVVQKSLNFGNIEFGINYKLL